MGGGGGRPTGDGSVGGGYDSGGRGPSVPSGGGLPTIAPTQEAWNAAPSQTAGDFAKTKPFVGDQDPRAGLSDPRSRAASGESQLAKNFGNPGSSNWPTRPYERPPSGSVASPSAASGPGVSGLGSFLTKEDMRGLAEAGSAESAEPDDPDDSAGGKKRKPRAGDVTDEEREDEEYTVPLLGKAAPVGTNEREDALIILALDKLSMRDIDGAITVLTKVLELNPNNAGAYLHRSTAYNIKGDYAAAEKDALVAIKLDPHSSKAFENMAWALLKQGRPLEALTAAGQAILIDPKSAVGYAIRAYAQEALGNHDGKMAAIAKAASLDTRFHSQYERGKKGAPIFNPSEDFSTFLLRRRSPFPLRRGRTQPESSNWPMRIAVFLFLFAVLGGGLYFTGAYEMIIGSQKTRFKSAMDSLRKKD